MTARWAADIRLLLGVLILLLSMTACELTAAPPPAETAVEGLAVTWVDNGALWFWDGTAEAPRTLATGVIGSPIFSPDAQYIAYTSGPQNAPLTLWVVAADEAAPQQLVSAANLPAPAETLMRQIGQVAWLDAQTLLFNTHFIPQEPGPGGGKAYDLWRADIPTGTVTNLLSDGQGGDFAINPSGTTIALSTPGRYGQSEGRIHTITPTGQQAAVLLTYPAVSTASEYAFAPHLQWLDETTLLTAIPDPDLIYPTAPDETPRTAALWRLTTDGEAVLLGAVPAIFFGLPRWSPDGVWLTYLQQVGDPGDNTLALILANGSGGNPQTITTQSTGQLAPAVWSAAGYTYTAESPGALWHGTPQNEPARIPTADQAAFWPLWVDANTLIYANAPAAPYELRAYHADTGTTTLIATVQTGPAAFDAIKTP